MSESHKIQKAFKAVKSVNPFFILSCPFYTSLIVFYMFSLFIVTIQNLESKSVMVMPRLAFFFLLLWLEPG